MGRANTKFSLEQIEKIAAQLRDMPEVQDAPTQSKADAVRLLIGEIEALKERGYTFDQIAVALTSNGLELTSATLKNYIHRAKQTRSETKNKRKSKRSSQKMDIISKAKNPNSCEDAGDI